MAKNIILNLIHQSRFPVNLIFCPLSRHRPLIPPWSLSRLYSSSQGSSTDTPTQINPFEESEIKRMKLFMNPQVQSLLRSLSGNDMSRIFRKRKLGQKLKSPRYKFMTEKELEGALEEANKKAETLMKMPPVLPPRKPIDNVLSFDPEIQGYMNYTLVMTDISMNIKHKDRIIVARDPCGTLRHANWEEREKMINIYFPEKERSLTTPKMFTNPQLLQNVLDRASNEDNTYEFILDRACFQFEPDDPLYISTVETTYNTINERAHYDFLKSTRHYGPMIFYFARTRKMDKLVLYNIQKERLDEVFSLVSLFNILFPESKSNAIAKEGGDQARIIRTYVQEDSLMKGQQELALNAYEEVLKRRKELEEGIERAHG